MKILIAEDDRLQKFHLGYLLNRLGHEVVEVTDGEGAWDALQTQPISIVFTDWMMPRMTGLELIQRIRSGKLARYVYLILCTARSSHADLVEGMRQGADDFLAKPVREDELTVRLSAAERVIALEQRLAEENRKLTETHLRLSLAYETMKEDLEAAARMQQSLLPPPATVNGVHFQSLFCPASVVAGDNFNFFPLTRNRTGFYLLDVSGHGVPSAMLAVTLSKLLTTDGHGDSPFLRQCADGYDVADPDQVFAALNKRFQGNGDMYFTMIYGVIDRKRQEFRLSLAGHPRPILLRKGRPPEMLGEGGFPLGILPEMDYALVRGEITPGDRLIMSSDGVTECMNAGGEQFGDARLTALLDRHREAPLKDAVQELEKAIRAWARAEDFEDDVSAVALELG